MEHIVSYSGGVGSFAAASLVVEEYGRGKVSLLFADTLIEDQDLYRFVQESASVLGVHLNVIQDGRTPWQVFEDEKFIGNTRVDPCSRVLKRELINRWIKERYEPGEVEIHVGIDASESHRLPAIVDRCRPYVYRALLVEKEIMLSTQHKLDICRQYGIEPPRLYTLGFPHNNCGGFCVKAGLGQFKMLWEKLPERYLEHEQAELDAIARNGKLKPFLRKRPKTGVRYLTMREYRKEFLETHNAEEDTFDIGGCACGV